MNPWDITAWIGAICLSIVIIAITGAIVAGLIKGNRGKGTNNRII